MRWLKEHKIFVSIISIITALIIVFFSAYNSIGSSNSIISTIVTTLGKPFSYVGSGVKNAYNGIFNYKELQEANKALQEENEALRKEINDNAMQKDELDRLENLYSALQAEPYKAKKGISANITSIDNGQGYRQFTVDIGKNKGLSEGEIVVDEKGIVGTVSDVNKNSATVTSIVDNSFKVSFILKRNTDILGIVQGDGKNGLTGYMLDKEANVVEGDILLTSGRGDIPKGIQIGKVSKVYYDNNKQLKVVEVRTTSEFHSMQKVIIVK